MRMIMTKVLIKCGYVYDNETNLLMIITCD